MGSPSTDGSRASIHSLRWYISVGFLMVGVGPLIFFGAQRLSALFATQNESIQQKHEPMAESLAQAIYGYLLDQYLIRDPQPVRTAEPSAPSNWASWTFQGVAPIKVAVFRS